MASNGLKWMLKRICNSSEAAWGASGIVRVCEVG